MLAYHNDPKVKAKYLSRVRAHAKADQIIHGRYWENGKGCAVGCTIHGSSHAAYETELGIPIALARLEDTLFEGQTNGKSMTFPARFLAAIKPGADLSCVHWKFLHWQLTEELVGRNDPLVAAAVKQCADVLVPLTKGLPVDKRAAESAASAAWSVESAARSVAWSTAWSAESAVWSAESARIAESAARIAESAAWSAESAAWSVESARNAESAESAESAARSARSAACAARSARSARSAVRAAESVVSATWSAAYIRMADKLIELLRAA